jgi:hypothetical protein
MFRERFLDIFPDPLEDYSRITFPQMAGSARETGGVTVGN